MNTKTLIFLIAIVLVSFILRIYKVTENPPSLNWDEASIGYNAYSILKTGKDEWGVPFPIHFKSYGEYKLPIQIYFSIPAIATFGLNDFGVRLTPVIYGTLTVLVAFFLGKAIFSQNTIALLTAFLLGISPWHIHLTRASFESSFSTFWIVLGMWILIKSFKQPRWFVLSTIPFAISVYTYNTARIFAPLFLTIASCIYSKQLIKKQVIIAGIVFVILIVPLLPFLISGEGKARYKLVSITDDPGLIPRINEYRGNSNLPPPLPQLIHNKVTYTGLYFTQHYLAHFTPDFLFISGAPHKQHHVQGLGELYFFQAPFLLLGLYLIFRTRETYRWMIVIWLLLAYIPVAATNDSIPHALRTLIAVPTYQLVTAYGMFYLYVYIHRRYKNFLFLSNSILITVIFLSLVHYLYNYYYIYPINYSRDWQYGYKQVVEYIKNHQNEYDEIVFTRHYGEPHMFTLFYLNYDPQKYFDNPNLIRYETYDWVRVLRFDNFYFPDLGDTGTNFEDIVKDNPDKKLLFIGKLGDFPAKEKRLKTVYFLNSNEAFEIIEKK